MLYNAKSGLLLWLSYVTFTSQNGNCDVQQNYNPCCSYPCMNFGICNRMGLVAEYSCDCYGTGYYGDNCEIATWRVWIKSNFMPSRLFVKTQFERWEYFWSIVNSIDFLSRMFLRVLLRAIPMRPKSPEAFSTAASYTTWDGYANKSYYALTMQPVPENCPTPMGIAGPTKFPDPEELVKRLFTRTKFKPCPHRSSLLLPYYGQHVTHQVFKSIREFPLLTWGQHTIDMSHIYGETLQKQRILRSMEKGKMKMQVLNGEEYPPKLIDCPGIVMLYPASTPEYLRFALGHPFYALLPSLLYWSTLWLREHNRVCDIMAQVHPHWDDERLFQTAKLITQGEALTISTSSYIQQFSASYLKLRYLPELLHDTTSQWENLRVTIEFNTLYRWHSMMPDFFTIAGKNYTLKDIHFNAAPLVDHGTAAFTASSSKQIAGRGSGGRNMAKLLHPVAVQTIKMNRDAKLPSLNRYREYFGLPKHKTFEELTGERRLAKVLRNFYIDVDAVEFYVGIFAEKIAYRQKFGQTINAVLGNHALKILYSNALGSPEYWRESTFGGKVGFDIVRAADLKGFVCRNVEGCPTASFRVEDGNGPVSYEDSTVMVYDDLEEITPNEENNKKNHAEL